MTVLMSVRYLEIEGRVARRVLLPDPLRHARHDDHGGRHRSHHHLHRPRDDGGVVLHPGRLHQAEPAIERGGGEVLPARRVLARHPALRHVADVRPVGHDATCARWRRRSPGRSAIRGWCSRSSWSSPASGFKIAAVPFHMWAPDVYEGAPTPITAFLSVGSKAASFAMLLRIFLEGLPVDRAPTGGCCSEVLAIVTMTVGNVAALTQSNLKRMLAYSSIAHAGYLLIGVVAGTPRGITAMLVYLLVYAFMQLGAFAVIVAAAAHGRRRRRAEGLQRPALPQPVRGVRDAALHAVARRHPADRRLHGQVLAVRRRDRRRLLLAGGDRRPEQRDLALLLRPDRRLHVPEEGDDGSEPSTTPALAVALGVAVAATLLLGVYPRLLFEVAEASARTLGAAASPRRFDEPTVASSARRQSQPTRLSSRSRRFQAYSVAW